jgi:hypothetical protein
VGWGEQCLFEGKIKNIRFQKRPFIFEKNICFWKQKMLVPTSNENLCFFEKRFVSLFFFENFCLFGTLLFFGHLFFWNCFGKKKVLIFKREEFFFFFSKTISLKKGGNLFSKTISSRLRLEIKFFVSKKSIFLKKKPSTELFFFENDYF